MASGTSPSGSAQVTAGWKTLKGGRPAEAMKLFDAALAQLGKPSTDREANALMYAVLGRGEALQHLALEGSRSWDEEVEARRDFVERYGRVRGPQSDDLVVKSIFQLAQGLGRAGRAEESSAALDRLIDGFDDSTDESVKRLVWEARGI